MAPRSSSTSPTKASGNGAVAPKVEAFQRLLTLMDNRAQLEADTESTSQMDTVARIFMAEGDEIWDADEKTSIGGRNLGNVEMTVHAFLVRRSRGTGPKGNIFKDPQGNGMYVEVASTRLSRSGDLRDVEPGEDFTWNTSAPAVVAKLIRLEQEGMLPTDCYMQEIDLGDGTSTIKLKPIGRRTVVSGTAVKDDSLSDPESDGDF